MIIAVVHCALRWVTGSLSLCQCHDLVCTVQHDDVTVLECGVAAQYHPAVLPCPPLFQFNTPPWEQFVNGTPVRRGNSYQQQGSMEWGAWVRRAGRHWSATVNRARVLEEDAGAWGNRTRFLTVKYEDMVARPVDTVAAVLVFLGT